MFLKIVTNNKKKYRPQIKILAYAILLLAKSHCLNTTLPLMTQSWCLHQIQNHIRLVNVFMTSERRFLTITPLDLYFSIVLKFLSRFLLSVQYAFSSLCGFNGFIFFSIASILLTAFHTLTIQKPVVRNLPQKALHLLLLNLISKILSVHRIRLIEKVCGSVSSSVDFLVPFLRKRWIRLLRKNTRLHRLQIMRSHTKKQTSRFQEP